MTTQPDPAEQMKQLQEALKGGAVFVIGGIFSLVITLGMYAYDRYLYASRTQTTGYVTGITTETFEDKDTPGGTKNEKVTTFQFYAGGNPHTITATTSAYSKGDTVEILYNEKNPDRAAIAPNLLIDYVVIGAAAALTLLGLFKSLRAKRA